jgi:RHS repeat-associated protein
VSSTPYTYDENGNLADDGVYKYYYDCENRLIDVNSQGNSPVASYKYDYQGRRVKKIDYTLSPARCTLYCYDGDQVIAECNESGDLLRKFIYGLGIDEPICMILVNGETETRYYYHFDGLGSVVAISDSNSNVVEKYSYDVFGEPNTTSTIDNPYYFTGRRYDTETGLYYYRARYYDYMTGRFLQVDPLGYEDSMNMYTYVGNNPINLLDPYGLCKDDIESKRRRINQLRNYVKSAETAMIANIETLEILHGKVQRLHDYYWWLLVGNTTVSAVSVVNTAYTFSQAASYANTAKVITTKLPVRGIGDASTWDASIRLCDMSAKTFISAKKSAFIDAGFTTVSFLSVLRIDKARRKSI